MQDGDGVSNDGNGFKNSESAISCQQGLAREFMYFVSHHAYDAKL
jgi:hypothetical protein